jgi:hypothetical protein
MTLAVTRSDIERVYPVIAPHTRRTPVVSLSGADFGLPPFTLTLKLEQLEGRHTGDAPTSSVAAHSLAPRRVGELMVPIAQALVERVASRQRREHNGRQLRGLTNRGSARHWRRSRRPPRELTSSAREASSHGQCGAVELTTEARKARFGWSGFARDVKKGCEMDAVESAQPIAFRKLAGGLT